MKIWLDADAAPQVVRDILFRAATRLQIPVTSVANRLLRVPPSALFDFVVVGKTPDAADHVIAKGVLEGDLVITQDIPLAAEVVAKGATAIGLRGELWDESTVREKLSLRDFYQGLRDSGAQLGGPSAFGQRDTQNFAARLDAFLNRHAKAKPSAPSV